MSAEPTFTYPTPKTLDEALTIAICQARGPDMLGQFKMIIKDFLAQKFNVAMLQNPDVEQMLKELFKECVSESKI